MRLEKCCSRMVLFITLLVMLSMGILTGCAKEVSNLDADTGLSQKLDEYVKAFNEVSSKQKINGNILIAKDGKIIAFRSYGMADIKNNVPVGEDTVFRMCSITKFFTALGIMQLYEKGLLDLDDKISKYFPEQKRGDEITIHQLLTHTSGIVAGPVRDSDTNVYGYNAREKLVKAINSWELAFEPGEKMVYSNFGITLLASIIEKVSGMTYEEYMDKNVLSIAGMKKTGFDKSKDEIKNLALPYIIVGEKLMESIQYDMSFAFGAGNLYSTAKDMYLFDLALNEEKLVSKATLEIMTKTYTKWGENSGYGYGCGYGCETGDVRGHRWFGHPGNLPNGYAAYYMRFPDDDLTVIVQCNRRWNDSDSIVRAIGTIALGEEYRLPGKKTDTRIEQSLLKKYEGKYRKPSGEIINVKVYNNSLAISSSNYTTKILPCSETEFFERDYEQWDHIFEIGKDGKVMAYIIRDSTDETRMEKIE